MTRQHTYHVTVTWTGNTGTGTSGYRTYKRSHEVAAIDKAPIQGSSDPAFRGDATRWSPEDLLVASLSACHKLWYLHLCAEAGICVLAYIDDASGVMDESGDGSGQFVGVTLRPRVTIATGGDEQRALALHHEAHQKCFIARSVNFPITCDPSLVTE